MPAHPSAIAEIDNRIAAAWERGDKQAADHYLEQRWKLQHLATNWDADQWGLDPDDEQWMELKFNDPEYQTKDES